MRAQPFPEPDLWNDGEVYYQTELESKLAASIELEYQKQKARLDSDKPTAPSHTEPIQPSQTAQYSQPNRIAIMMPTAEHQPLAQLMSGCGIAAVDGYLTIRDYATSKGLDLIELHHKGIDLQDLVSTLIIHTQRVAEMDGGRRFRR